MGSSEGHGNVLEVDAVRSREQHSHVAVSTTAGARAEGHHEQERAESRRDEPSRPGLGSAS